MPRAVRDSEVDFRRGLVMGLTLAEVMLLVLFALLLILGWRVQASAAADKAPAKLVELESAAGLPASTNADFDENFKRLVLRTKAGRASVAAFEEAAKRSAADSDLAEIQALTALGAAAKRVLGRNRMGVEDTRAAHDVLARIDPLYGESPSGSADLWLSGLLQCAKGCGPKGDLPPCARTAAGKPALIFDATLNSGSIVLTENSIPELAEVRKQWPTDTIALNTPLSSDVFLEQTRPLFEWSEQRACRFFVNIVDATTASEKVVYKARLRTVESHFYKHESIGTEPGQ